jgi:hypothetical protein
MSSFLPYQIRSIDFKAMSMPSAGIAAAFPHRTFQQGADRLVMP